MKKVIIVLKSVKGIKILESKVKRTVHKKNSIFQKENKEMKNTDWLFLVNVLTKQHITQRKISELEVKSEEIA